MSFLVDGHILSMALIRGILGIAVIGMVGGVGFYHFVFAPSLQAISGDDLRPLEEEALGFTRRLVLGGALLILLLHPIALVHEVKMMSGASLADTLPLLPQVLTQTHWGRMWIVRSLLLLLLLEVNRRRGAASYGILILVVGAAGSVSLISHAVRWGTFSLPVLADFVHLTAVSFWIGGLLPLRRLSRGAFRALAPERQGRFLSEQLDRFSRLALVAVSSLFLTGIYSAWLHLPDASALLHRPYGRVLLLKMGFAALTLCLGGGIRFILLPRLREECSSMKWIRIFWGVVLIEMLSAAGALLSAFLLTQVAPTLRG